MSSHTISLPPQGQYLRRGPVPARYPNPDIFPRGSGLNEDNLGPISVPGKVTFMAMLFLAAGVAGDIWKEKSTGTMRRVVVTPSTIAGFWGGRILAMGAVFAAVGMVALLAAAFAAAYLISHTFRFQ